MTFTRTLNFTSNNLNRDVSLVLTFDDPNVDGGRELYDKKDTVCWRVVKLPPEGQGNSTVTYQNQLAFTKPQVDEQLPNSMTPGTYVDIDLGQKTEPRMTSNSDSTAADCDFTSPVTGGSNGRIIATSQTEPRQPIGLGVGFHVDENRVDTAMLWKDIGSKTTVDTQFIPVLREYVFGGDSYKEGDILRGEVHSDCCFSQDLRDLPESSEWVVEHDFVSGAIDVRRA